MENRKFRGKEISTGKWVYGDLVTRNEKCEIYFWEPFSSSGSIRREVEVIPESVGQFTGLKDSKQNHIYEGDVLKFPNDQDVYRVSFKEGGFCLHWLHTDAFTETFWLCSNRIQNKSEIVGNVHEPTAELLALRFQNAEKLECAMCGAENSFVIDSENPSIGYCLAENRQFTLKINLDELVKLKNSSAEAERREGADQR